MTRTDGASEDLPASPISTAPNRTVVIQAIVPGAGIFGVVYLTIVELLTESRLDTVPIQ